MSKKEQIYLAISILALIGLVSIVAYNTNENKKHDEQNNDAEY